MSDPAPVYVVFDYVCPYAYVGKHRADALERTYDIDVTYLPWEIYPSALPEGQPVEGDAPDRYEQWVDGLADEVDATLDGPDTSTNSNLALKGFLYARDQGEQAGQAYHSAAFEAVWSEGRNLGREAVLRDVAEEAGLDPDDLLETVDHRSYQFRLERIKRYVEEELGVQRVPTFVFGDQRIVGNDPFEPSLKQPLEAFLERRKALGGDWTSTLEHDLGLHALR